MKKIMLSVLVLASSTMAANLYASTESAASQLLQSASNQQVLKMGHTEAKQYGKNHLYAQLKALAQQEVVGGTPAQPDQCTELTGQQMVKGASLTTKATVQEIMGHKVPKYGVYWALDGASIGVDAANYAQLCDSADTNQKELG